MKTLQRRIDGHHVDKAQPESVESAPSPAGKKLLALTPLALIGVAVLVLQSLSVLPVSLVIAAVVSSVLFGIVFYRIAKIVRSLESALRAQRQIRAELHRAASLDPLTGLANRAFLTAHLEQRLSRTKSMDTAALFLDLDSFKAVNDQYGHAAGDALLIELADRLVGCTRRGDVVGRIGGDEFVIVLDLCDRAAQPATAATAERILAALRHPVWLHNSAVHVSASIGIAWPEMNGISAEDLLADADAAMYEAKRRGKDCVSFASHSVQELPRTRDFTLPVVGAQRTCA